MDLTCALLLFLTILTIIYYYLVRPLDYWKKQGVTSASGTIPGFGNVLSVLLVRENLSSLVNRLYKSGSSKSSMIGMFFLRTPMLIVREPDLIKTVLVKDYQNFQSNMQILSEKQDPFLSKNPFFTRGETWKRSRSLLLSSMSQKKLKVLYRILHDVSIKFDDFLNKILKRDSSPELELKALCMRLTGELVANTAFGIEGHNFDLEPNPRSFNAMVDKLFKPSLLNGIRRVLTYYLPNLGALLNVSFMPRAVSDFLRDTVKCVIRHRREKGIIVDDFLQMLMEGCNETDEETATDYVSSYFFDAYETSANVAAFACYRLSYNPNIQETARKEIEAVCNKYEGTLTYEALKEMTYLDQILNETVRLHPILGVSLKICNEKTTLHGSDGQTCCLEPGNIVSIPVDSLHQNEQYWKDPTVFDPDRFSEERMNEITKFTFLPFGEGPRMCPAMRYGIMIVKTILVMVLKNCIIEVSNKTKLPLKYDQNSLLTVAEGGLWAKLENIHN